MPEDTAQTAAPSPPTPVPTKGSSLGVFALLCALLGAGGCVVLTIVGFMAPDLYLGMPLTAALSFVGFVLGVVAYFRAKPPTPRGAAIAATFLGIIVGVVQGAVIIGSLITFLPIRAQVVPGVDAMLAAHDAGDPSGAAALLGVDALDEIDGETLLAFFDRVERETGPVTSAHIELRTMLVARTVMSDYQPRADSDPSGFTNAKPVELRTANTGTVLMYAWLDEAALKDQRVVFHDLLAFLPSGRILILRTDGPANLLAGNFNAVADLP